MRLLHFAYANEAIEFIKNLKLKPASDIQGLYIGEDIILLISGEGLYDSMYKMGFIFAKFQIREVINLGISGALNPKIKRDQILKVRTVYSFNELSPKFQSFTSADQEATVDCISSEKRALEMDYVQKLTPLADIVDRELWSVAKTCKYFKTPFYSYKYISDIAGIDSNCLDIKDKADFYSLKLLEFYLDQEYQIQEEIKSTYNSPYKMGHYLHKKYEKVLDKLLKSNYSSEQEILSKIDLNEIDKLKKKDKEKASILIEKLECLLNPIDKIIQKKTKVLFNSFLVNGIKIETDPNLEKKYFKISKQINSQKNLDDIVKSIKNFEYKDLENFWEGNLDV